MLYRLERSMHLMLEGLDKLDTSLILEATQEFDQGYAALLKAAKAFQGLTSQSSKLSGLTSLVDEIIASIEKVDPSKVPDEFSFMNALALQQGTKDKSKDTSGISLAASRLNCLVGGTKDAIIEISKWLETSDIISVSSNGISLTDEAPEETKQATLQELVDKLSDDPFGELGAETVKTATQVMVAATPDPKVQGAIKKDEGGFLKKLFGKKDNYKISKKEASSIVEALFQLTIPELNGITTGLIEMSGGVVQAATQAVEGTSEQGEEVMQPSDEDKEFIDQLKQHIDDDDFAIELAAHIASLSPDPSNPDPSKIPEDEFLEALKKHLSEEEIENLADELEISDGEGSEEAEKKTYKIEDLESKLTSAFKEKNPKWANEDFTDTMVMALSTYLQDEVEEIDVVTEGFSFLLENYSFDKIKAYMVDQMGDLGADSGDKYGDEDTIITQFLQIMVPVLKSDGVEITGVPSEDTEDSSDEKELPEEQVEKFESKLISKAKDWKEKTLNKFGDLQKDTAFKENLVQVVTPSEVSILLVSYETFVDTVTAAQKQEKLKIFERGADVFMKRQAELESYVLDMVKKLKGASASNKKDAKKEMQASLQKLLEKRNEIFEKVRDIYSEIDDIYGASDLSGPMSGNLAAGKPLHRNFKQQAYGFVDQLWAHLNESKKMPDNFDRWQLLSGIIKR